MPDFAFDSTDLAVCQRLAYTMRTATAQDASGMHRTRRTGEGTDFLDFRPYTPGDDVRRIDWTVFARVRQPYVRVLQQETVLFVNFLIDVSRSMAAGQAQSKAALACRLACALAYIGLHKGDRVSAGAFSDRWTALARDLRGPAALPTLVDALRRTPLGRGTDLEAATRTFRAQARHRGLAVLISDFLSPIGCQEPVRGLMADGFRVLVIQVLDAVDWGQGLTGFVRLRDSETDYSTDVEVTSQEIDDYRDRLRGHVERMEAFCRQRGQAYLLASTRDDWGVAVARALRERGIFR